MTFTDPHDALRHHVTGAVERGEKDSIQEVTDPNADLIGFQYQSGIETVTVLGSASWSSTYVQIRYPSGFESIQRAELVRAKKEAVD